MNENLTKLEHLIDPEVMAPMISAKLGASIVATPFAKIDDTLQGQSGSTITVPKYEYIGDAEDVAEGVEQGESILSATSKEYKVKKAVKDVILTDEAVLSGYGNPVGEANNQLGMAIANKVDNDVVNELLSAQLVKKSAKAISYDGIADAIDLFNEEENVEKAMLISPHQNTTLRKDPNFISKEKYGNEVMMKGEIGMILNTRIVPSRKITLTDAYTKVTDPKVANIATYYEKNGNVYTLTTDTTLNSEKTYYTKDSKKIYRCPIIKLNPETQTDDDTSAVTIFMKRGVNVEKDRKVKGKKTLISVDEHYVAALTDESKVVVAEFPEDTTEVAA